MNRDDCLNEDARDPLAPLRDQFALDRVDAAGIIYLDGNSLGVLPKAAIDRARDVVENEWGVGLIRSWTAAGWIDLSQRIGDKIAPLIGARPGEIIVADSTSVNLFKALSAAVALRLAWSADGSHSDPVGAHEFPDRSLHRRNVRARARPRAHARRSAEIASHLDDRVAVLMLTHASYRTGRMYRHGERDPSGARMRARS